jgi:hypothetical protein
MAILVTGAVAASYAIPNMKGPVRVFLDCRRARSSTPGKPGEDGTSLHVLWERSGGTIKVPAGVLGELAYLEFDADDHVDLPEGCGTLKLVGGAGEYEAAIYEARPLTPELYRPRRRRLSRVLINPQPGLRFIVPRGHERIGSALVAGVTATSDGVTSRLTPTPEACVAGQLYAFSASARIFTETLEF